jgi:uncharacterized RDD family membrane protein YckC
MKCPKCNYLGFERVDRCKNCGYDFSLSAPVPEPDFAIRRDREPIDALPDLSLVDTDGDWRGDRSRPDLGADLDLDRLFGAADPVPAAAPEAAMPPPQARVVDLPPLAPREELPLFGPPIPDDEPLITRASPPRPPLAVRRATPEVPKLRTEAPLRTPSFDLESDPVPSTPAPFRAQADRIATSDLGNREEALDAGVGARLLAVMVDFLILAAVDAVVIYFTMQLCYLTIGDLGILPKGPLVAFLLVQNGGYLVAFTASGQTLGKMVAGIRVVQSDTAGPLDIGHAFLRTLMWVALAVPAGLGFLTALFSRDHRGLHDRFAGTRVVRASA